MCDRSADEIIERMEQDLGRSVTEETQDLLRDLYPDK